MTALARRLREGREGAVAVLGAFGILMLGAGAMFAADMGRVQIVSERLQMAADAAMLAAARDLGKSDATVRAVATQVFQANIPADLAGITVQSFEVTFNSVDPVLATEIQVDASVRLPLLIANLAEFLGSAPPSIADVSVESRAVKRTMGAEVAMVLDNTGSMNGARIASLRSAATTLAQTLFGDKETVPNLLVSIVPYSATVNIGTQHVDWLDPVWRTGLAVYLPTVWKGCIMARSPALAETDDPAGDGKWFSPFYWPSSRVTALGVAPAVFDAFHGASPNMWPILKSGNPAVDERQAAGNNGFGPNLGCPAPITPLTASRTEIMTAIAALEAWHRGGTMGNLGLVWGWRAISPRWRGLWRRADGSVIENAPLDYGTPFNNKIVVMMTDGENQFFNKDFTSYKRASEVMTPPEIDASMLRLCEKIKQSGAILYTIIFGGGFNAAVEARYRTCASDPVTEERILGPKYFNAPTGAMLEQAFRNIGGQIQDLRLIR